MRIFVATLTAAAFLIFTVTLVQAVFLSPVSDITVPGTGTQPVTVPPEEQPGRLAIPKIGVDAHIQYVGLGKTGNMAVPTNYRDVGWYRMGTVPGQVGSAVIDGHMDNGFGLPAVFKRISEMRAGDDIYVVTREGRRLHFKVEEVASYAVKDVPLEKLFLRNDVPRLNLVTCEGAWIPAKKMYDSRLVAYAVLVDTE